MSLDGSMMIKKQKSDNQYPLKESTGNRFAFYRGSYERNLAVLEQYDNGRADCRGQRQNAQYEREDLWCTS